MSDSKPSRTSIQDEATERVAKRAGIPPAEAGEFVKQVAPLRLIYEGDGDARVLVVKRSSGGRATDRLAQHLADEAILARSKRPIDDEAREEMYEKKRADSRYRGIL